MEDEGKEDEGKEGGGVEDEGKEGGEVEDKGKREERWRIRGRGRRGGG